MAVNFDSINKIGIISTNNSFIAKNIEQQQKTNVQNKLSRSPKVDEASITTKKGEKVTFGEGAGLIAKGFGNKVKDYFMVCFKHPMKVLGAAAVTIGGLAALPLIGISSLAGAALLTVGFASLAVGNTIAHTAKAIKHNKNGEYNKVRTDLRKIGSDGLDLALSLPFVPKGLKQIQSQIKYKNSFKFDTTLWNTVKETKGLWNKSKEVAKADVKMLYQMQTKELGLKTAPELTFAEFANKNHIGGFNNRIGELFFNAKLINPFNINYCNSVLRHELRHFEQASQMTRLNNGITRLETVTIKRNCKPEIEEYETILSNLLKAKKEQLATLDKTTEAGKIVEAEIAGMQEFLKLLKNDPKKAIMKIKTNSIKKVESELAALKQQKAPIEQIKQKEQALELLKSDPSINTVFYEKVIKNNHNGQKIVQGSQEEKVALDYLKAWEEYPDAIGTKEYFNNILEKEAYSVGNKYKRFRADPLLSTSQEQSSIANE